MTIRNFVIISHIDHGKSTLADRLIELTGTIPKEKMIPQILDRHPIERQRGITIKMQPVRMNWRQGDSEYVLNLIDTPGHVDFAYEVSRALACVQGAILLVDASQGVQAQTLTTYWMAREHHLVVIPVINKIDLPQAKVNQTAEQFKKLVPDWPEPLRISAKNGQGVSELLQAIIRSVPPPTGAVSAPTQALIFDSVYDTHRGVVAYITVFNGSIKKNQSLYLSVAQQPVEAMEIGVFKPHLAPTDALSAGEVGYLVTNQRYIRLIPVGDTVVGLPNSKSKIEKSLATDSQPLPGFRRPQPMVWATIFSPSPTDTPLLRQAIERLQLNDSAIQFEPQSSPTFGPGFRIGVLGLLHLEVVIERLERDFGQTVVITKPTVTYRLVGSTGQPKMVHSIGDLPSRWPGATIEEPWVVTTIISPLPYLGKIIETVAAHRGVITQTESLTQDRLVVKADLPFCELMVDFYDRLKSISAGYASLAYEFLAWRPANLVLLKVLVANEPITPLSQLVHQDKIDFTARQLLRRLKPLIPRQQFEVKIQVAAGGRVLATDRVPAYRKDVTAKLYGGDITRKRKLLDQQKIGKKRLRQFGQVEFPPEFFLAALKI